MTYYTYIYDTSADECGYRLNYSFHRRRQKTKIKPVKITKEDLNYVFS